jgi:hypothetical protein
MSLALVNFETRVSEVLEAFREAMEYKELKYGGHVLQSCGFNEADISKAIERSILLCKSQEIDPRRHFRYYYKVDMLNSQVSKEWRMSKTGMYLALCNGDPRNPYVSAFQLKLIKPILL